MSKEIEQSIAELFIKFKNDELFSDAVTNATEEELVDFNLAIQAAATNDKKFFLTIEKVGSQVGGLLSVMIIQKDLRDSMKEPDFRLGDGLFQAVYYKGDAYCNDCLPEDVDLAEGMKDGEVEPVAITDELYYPPRCVECHYEHGYMTIDEE